MRNFLTKQRLTILLIALLVGAVCVVLAFFVGYQSLFGSLLINLSASALTIALTLIVVDYYLSEEKRIKSRPMRVTGELEVWSVVFNISSTISILFKSYKFDKDVLEACKDENVIYHQLNLIRYADEKLNCFDDNYKLILADINIYSNSLYEAAQSLDIVMASYAHTFSPEAHKQLYQFYMNFKAALSMIKANESLVVAFKNSKDKSKLAEHKNISDQMIKLSAKALYENISNSMTEFTKITLTSVEK